MPVQADPNGTPAGGVIIGGDRVNPNTGVYIPPVYGAPAQSPTYTAPTTPIYFPLDPNLPKVDGGGTLFGYIPPLPDLGGSTGGSTGTGSGLGTGSFGDTFSTQEFQDLILNDPRYKQLIETLDEDKRIADERAAQELQWFKEEYDRRSADIGAAGSGGGSDAALKALEQLQKEKAAHDKALAEKAIKEQMASRGMASSGQAGFEQGELQYDYETLLKEIDLQAQARQEARAAAAASAARASASARAELDANFAKGLKQAEWDSQDRTRDLARAKGNALMTVGSYIWNENKGVYENGAGQTKTPQEAAASVGNSGYPTLDFSNYTGLPATGWL